MGHPSQHHALLQKIVPVITQDFMKTKTKLGVRLLVLIAIFHLQVIIKHVTLHLLVRVMTAGCLRIKTKLDVNLLP